MSLIVNHDATVGQLVGTNPSLSKVFEKLGIDYCCGGKKPITDVCKEKGLNVEVVFALIEAAEQLRTRPEEDVSTFSLSRLAQHIYETHHDYLYEALPRLEQLANKVASVHGPDDPRLTQARDTLVLLKEDMMSHLAKEENVLFPYCEQLDTAAGMPYFHCGAIANPIRVMEQEHEMAGELLARLRSLTDDYTPPSWACNTYRALLDGLAELEADTHQHIHKENNILFPRAIVAYETLLRRTLPDYAGSLER